MRALSRPVPLAALVLAGVLAAWIITVQRMRGMDAGPGTDLGGLGWYVGIWVTMTAAMMLPSAAPVVLLFARAWSERTRAAALVPAAIFVSGYLVVWTAYGLAAYGVYRAVVSAGTGWLAWNRAGPYVAGGALIAAGHISSRRSRTCACATADRRSAFSSAAASAARRAHFASASSTAASASAAARG